MKPITTHTRMERPTDRGLTIRWGHDTETMALQLGIWHRGRCIQVGFEDADRNLSAEVFYHRYVHPALLALADA